LKTLATLDTNDLCELETIDTLLTKILLEADQHCSPPQMDPWSPALNQAYLRHRYWSIALSAKHNQRDMTSVLQSIQARLIPTPEDDEAHHRSITANLRWAQKNLRQAKRDADQLRKQHLEKIKGLSEYEIYKPQIEEFRQRALLFGFQPATRIVVVGQAK